MAVHSSSLSGGRTGETEQWRRLPLAAVVAVAGLGRVVLEREILKRVDPVDRRPSRRDHGQGSADFVCAT
jgi:hypothetical protein